MPPAKEEPVERRGHAGYAECCYTMWRLVPARVRAIRTTATPEATEMLAIRPTLEPRST